jgi:hypothetical protein
MASILISVVSLLLSLTVAWLTLFRRGKPGMTRPMLVGFLYEHDAPKIFFRAMLYATGKRGHIIEACTSRCAMANRRSISIVRPGCSCPKLCIIELSTFLRRTRPP